MIKIQNLVQLHINIVVNTLSVFIGEQQAFTLMIDGSSDYYKNQFPKEAYVDGKLIVLDISNWSLEESIISLDSATLNTKIVFGEDNVYDIVINAIDIIGIVTGNMHMPMYTRFFGKEFLEELNQHSEPHHSLALFDALAYEEANKEAIAKSTACLTLLNYGEQ